MSVIVGKCEHGIIICSAKEEYAERAELEGMAAAYLLERQESASLGGNCEICHRRYLANIRLLDTPTAARLRRCYP